MYLGGCSPAEGGGTPIDQYFSNITQTTKKTEILIKSAVPMIAPIIQSLALCICKIALAMLFDIIHSIIGSLDYILSVLTVNMYK